MRRLKFGWRIVGAIAFMLLPGVASAQARSRDRSRHVGRGHARVTVEAASDVLIEKTRSADRQRWSHPSSI